MGKSYRNKKKREKWFERIFYVMLAALAVLVVVLVIVANQPAAEGYVVTADGHVHDAAGNHVGEFDEMIADGRLVVTEDGHVHDAAGNHLGEVQPAGEEDAPAAGDERTEE